MNQNCKHNIFFFILTSSSATGERYSWMWLYRVRTVFERALDRRHAASLFIDPPFQIEIKSEPEPSWCRHMSSRFHSFYNRHSVSCVLLTVGSRLSKTDPLRSSAGFTSFLHCSWGTFPRITLIHDGWKHPEGKKREREVPLASIQQHWPLISAGTAHNDKGRQALTHTKRRAQ